MERLGLNGVKQRFSLTTLNGVDCERSGIEANLIAKGLNGEGSVSLPRVWSVYQIPVSERSIPMADDVKR